MREYYLNNEWVASKPKTNYENLYKVACYILFGLFIFTAYTGCLQHQPKVSTITNQSNK